MKMHPSLVTSAAERCQTIRAAVDLYVHRNGRRTCRRQECRLILVRRWRLRRSEILSEIYRTQMMWSDVQVRHNASAIIRDDVVTRHDVMLHQQLTTTRWQVAPRAYFTVECHLEMYSSKVSL